MWRWGFTLVHGFRMFYPEPGPVITGVCGRGTSSHGGLEAERGQEGSGCDEPSKTYSQWATSSRQCSFPKALQHSTTSWEPNAHHITLWGHYILNYSRDLKRKGRGWREKNGKIQTVHFINFSILVLKELSILFQFCVCVHMSTGTFWGRPWSYRQFWDTCWAWVLGTELSSSTKALSHLSLWAISPAPASHFWYSVMTGRNWVKNKNICILFHKTVDNATIVSAKMPLKEHILSNRTWFKHHCMNAGP